MQVSEVVLFLAVADMEKSIAFYVDGLGFSVEKRWAPGGELRWCQLRLGQAEVMLQQFPTQGHDARRFDVRKGEGITLCFFVDDAIELYRAVREVGLEASRPEVSNRLWTTLLADPDGYQLLFESPTDAPEGTLLHERP